MDRTHLREPRGCKDVGAIHGEIPLHDTEVAWSGKHLPIRTVAPTYNHAIPSKAMAGYSDTETWNEQEIVLFQTGLDLEAVACSSGSTLDDPGQYRLLQSFDRMDSSASSDSTGWAINDGEPHAPVAAGPEPSGEIAEDAHGQAAHAEPIKSPKVNLIPQCSTPSFGSQVDGMSLPSSSCWLPPQTPPVETQLEVRLSQMVAPCPLQSTFTPPESSIGRTPKHWMLTSRSQKIRRPVYWMVPHIIGRDGVAEAPVLNGRPQQ